MRILTSVFFVSFVLLACSNQKKGKYHPANYLSVQEQKRFKEKIIRYIGDAPRRVLGNQKFDTLYDEHYSKQVAQHDLLAYYISNDGEHFFLTARIAPSIDVKWVATGGRLRYGEDGELAEYEEVFRTWKMPRPILEERALYLFDLMVKGEDLEPYYAAKAGFNYIEFPDDHVYFDKELRCWKSDQYGSIEEMVYDVRDADSLSKKPHN